MPLRLVFMGTPDFAVPALLEIAGAGHDVAAVYARAPKPAGRGMEARDTPVAREAKRLGIAVLTPATLKTPEALVQFRAHKADVAVVVAYGLILPKTILDALPRGAFNIHASLLPRWRGAAPINRAIMAGDAQTGVTIMKMDEGLDTGPMASTHPLPIAADATAGDLHDRLAHLGAATLLPVLSALGRDSLTLTPQPHAGVTYAEKISKDETRIDWSRPARDVHNHIRGLSPFPGAWFEHAGARVKVLRSAMAKGNGAAGSVLDDKLTVACGEGAVRLIELQRAGKQPMKADEFLRGARIAPGEALS